MPGTSDDRVGAGADRGVRPAVGRVRRRLRVYSPSIERSRFRRATDILLLAPALVGLAFLIAAFPPSGFERSLEAFIAGCTSWLDSVRRFPYDLLGL